MKNSVKWILLTLLLVIIIGGAAILYPRLSKIYAPDLPEQPTTEQQEGAEQPANAAPDFTVLDQNGKEVKLSDFKGKPVVLNFWATWCYYCKVEMPDFNTAFQNYPEIEFLMINATDGVQETIEKAKSYLEENQFQFNAYFDTNLEAVNNYHITGFPATFFIDKDGNLITQANGMIDYETLVKGIEMIR